MKRRPPRLGGLEGAMRRPWRFASVSFGAAVGVVLVASPSIGRATEDEEAATEAERAAEPPPESAEGEVGPIDRGEPSVDLFAPDALGPVAGWELRPEPDPSTLEESSEEVLDRWMDDRMREHQIGAGAVDGWYYGMRQSMRSAFRPDRGAMESERRASMDPLQVVVDEAQRYAAPRQSTMDPGGHAPDTIWSRSRDDEYVQSHFDQRNPLYAPITWYRAELRVVQGRSGGVVSVHVTRSSGMPSMDAAAIAAIRSGTVSLPVPPASVLGERDTIASEWAFEVGDIATQIGVVGVMDAPTGDGVQGVALGRGAIRTSVQLLRVVDAAHPTFDERRARRRARERESGGRGARGERTSGERSSGGRTSSE
jgi:hypothetical protein